MPVATKRRKIELPTLEEIRAEQARRHQLAFMRGTWRKSEKHDPLLVGRHTRAVCERLDRAIVDYRAGRTTFLVVMCPIRHGKSDIVSRYLPPRFLGLFPDAEVMLTSYGADLAEDLSKFCREHVQTEAYQAVFPGIALAKDSHAVQYWSIAGHLGRLYATGGQGALTGRGFHLGILDDYCKNREQAESRTYRDKTWDDFRAAFMTRRAPVSITIVMASPWHVDDVIGRIRKAMEADPAFPRFEVMCFPARSEDYPGGYLFPERYGPEWYEGQFATLGVYDSSALLQCEPVPRGGSVLKTDRVQIVDQLPDRLSWVRAWDVASSTAERTGEDPDYTAGMLLAVDWRRAIPPMLPVPVVYIADLVRGRWEAPERDRRILRIADGDGARVKIAIEAVAGYKDTYTRIRDLLSGARSVRKINAGRDLLVRLAPLEAVFEAGNVILQRAPWNQAFLEEASAFTGSDEGHDDQLAALATGYEASKRSGTAKSLWEE